MDATEENDFKDTKDITTIDTVIYDIILAYIYFWNSYNSQCWKEVEELSLGSLPKAGSEREQLFQYRMWNICEKSVWSLLKSNF